MAAVAIQRGFQIWMLNTPELSKTFEGHTGFITCLHFAPNCELIATGSEDKSVIVWGLQFGILQTTFKAHNAAISCLTVMMDSRRIVTSDREGCTHVWLADSGTILQTIQGPYKFLAVTNNMKFAVSSRFMSKRSKVDDRHLLEVPSSMRLDWHNLKLFFCIGFDLDEYEWR
jgi:NACHT domain- and WD repeat-containing protein